MSVDLSFYSVIPTITYPSSPRIGRPVLRVPLVGASHLLQRPCSAIRFRNLREGSRSKGANLSDLFGDRSEPATLDGAEDIVLNGVGGPMREVKFVINWPGYAPERYTINTVSVHGGPLTRCELGRNIIYAYGKFFRKVVTESILPDTQGMDGSFKIALHQSHESRTSNSLGVHFSQLHLVKFREPVPGDDHWVAEVDIVPGY